MSGMCNNGNILLLCLVVFLGRLASCKSDRNRVFHDLFTFEWLHDVRQTGVPAQLSLTSAVRDLVSIIRTQQEALELIEEQHVRVLQKGSVFFWSGASTIYMFLKLHISVSE
jgi:hypothetical protein